MAEHFVRCGYGKQKIDMDPDEFFALPKDHILKKGYWKHIYKYTIEELSQIGGAVTQKYGGTHLVEVNGVEFELDSNVLRDSHNNIGQWFGKVAPIHGNITAVNPKTGATYTSYYGMLDLITGEVVATAESSLTPVTDSIYIARTDDMWINRLVGRGNVCLHVVEGDYWVEQSRGELLGIKVNCGRGIANLDYGRDMFTVPMLNQMLLEKQAEAKISRVIGELVKAGVPIEQATALVVKTAEETFTNGKGKGRK